MYGTMKTRIIYIDFTNIADSNVKIDEKCSRSGGFLIPFNDDLDSGLLFLGHPVYATYCHRRWHPNWRAA